MNSFVDICAYMYYLKDCGMYVGINIVNDY